jgi:hypothetical protein
VTDQILGIDLADLDSVQANPALLKQAKKLMADLQKKRAAEQEQIRLSKAAEDLLTFAQHTMPDQSVEKDAPWSTRYKPTKHHRALAASLHKVEAGEWLNLIITMPPRHGKSELASKRFIPWFLGRDASRQVILATYSDTFAGDYGREVRTIMRSPEFGQVFPKCKLQFGSQSADRLTTTWNGGAIFAGRGGAITGRGADLAIVDDPLKDAKEANSPATREALWEWFNKVLMSRLLSSGGRVVIIMTRWHEDDLVGRLTDPANPYYSEEEASKWRMLELPALAGDNDPLGREPGAALWPERFPTPYLLAIKNRDAGTFSALYQGRPSPEEGAHFKREHIVPYRSVRDIPDGVRWYAASDHALKLTQKHDRTCMGCAGLDANGEMWLSPNIEWGRFPPDETVKRMVGQMLKYKPMVWWAENDHISSSLGPFLRREMISAGATTVVEQVSAAADPMQRSQSIRALMALKVVHFPVFMPWWQQAQDELMKFPNGTHDDFVSFLSHLGMGINRMLTARRPQKYVPPEPATGTVAWLKRNLKQLSMLQADNGGF